MNDYDDIIIRYFDGQLSVNEIKEFEGELETRTELKNAFESYRKVNELFSTKDEQLADQDYFSEIIPRFRQKLDKVTYVSPIRKISFTFATILLIISSYLLFQNYFFNQSATNYSIQSITENLSEQEMNELADYISDDFWNPISGEEKLLILEETDFSLEGVVANASVEEGVMILSDYQINDIYSLADEKELEIAYNEILTKRIF
jgi:hypothetical protein